MLCTPLLAAFVRSFAELAGCPSVLQDARCRGFCVFPALLAPRTLESDLNLRASSLEAHSQLRIEIRQLAGLGARLRPKSNKLPSVL